MQLSVKLCWNLSSGLPHSSCRTWWQPCGTFLEPYPELAIVHVFKVFLHFAFSSFSRAFVARFMSLRLTLEKLIVWVSSCFSVGRGGQDGTIIMRLCAHCCERLDSCSIVFRWLLAFGESERNYLFSSRLLFEGSGACPAPPPLLPSPSMIDVVAFACAGSVACPARPP